jgi:hypothetical protein
VGCLELGLGRMRRDGPIDGWEPLIRPAVRTFTGRLWQRLTGPRPLAELRLTASAQECGVDQMKDPEEGQPAEVLKDSAANRIGATENLILTGRPLPSTRTPSSSREKSGGLYAQLVFESHPQQRPPRAQLSTPPPSPELGDVPEPPVILAKPRAGSPSLAAAPYQKRIGHNDVNDSVPGSSSADAPAPPGDGEARRRSSIANIIEPLNCFNLH